MPDARHQMPDQMFVAAPVTAWILPAAMATALPPRLHETVAAPAAIQG